MRVALLPILLVLSLIISRLPSMRVALLPILLVLSLIMPRFSSMRLPWATRRSLWPSSTVSCVFKRFMAVAILVLLSSALALLAAAVVLLAATLAAMSPMS